MPEGVMAETVGATFTSLPLPPRGMAVKASRLARALSLFNLTVDCSAFVAESLFLSSRTRTVLFHLWGDDGHCSWYSTSPALRSSSGRTAAVKSLLCMAENSQGSEGGVNASLAKDRFAEFRVQGHENKRKNNNGAKNSLQDALGAGRGKHAGRKRRRHCNKYSSESKVAEVDPWEQQLQESEAHLSEAEALERAQLEELEERKIQRRKERGLVEYPDEEDIDPYDPSTFGYIEVGQIQGAHGIKGEVKVRSSTDFAVKRLCTPGTKHIKAPNRRFPRDVELMKGRWQKEEIFLLKFEGVDTRDAAAALRGHKMYVLEDEEVDLEENEYLVRDLVGGRAYRLDDESVYIGEVVGVVLGDDISSTAGIASDMLELRLPLENPGDVPKECYIPFVPALVPEVRVGNGDCTILMDLPEGLLDLAVEVEEKVVIRGFLPPAER